MSNIYDLTGVYVDLQNQLLENPDDEVISGILETIDDEVEKKADGYAGIIANLTSDVEGIKAEEKRLKERRQALESNIDRLKENLFNTMKVTGKTKFKTNLFSFNIQKNGGAAPVVVTVDTSKLPDDLVIITEKPDLKALAKYIEETGDVSYGYIGERGESLRIK